MKQHKIKEVQEGVIEKLMEDYQNFIRKKRASLSFDTNQNNNKNKMIEESIDGAEQNQLNKGINEDRDGLNMDEDELIKALGDGFVKQAWLTLRSRVIKRARLEEHIQAIENKILELSLDKTQANYEDLNKKHTEIEQQALTVKQTHDSKETELETLREEICEKRDELEQLKTVEDRQREQREQLREQLRLKRLDLKNLESKKEGLIGELRQKLMRKCEIMDEKKLQGIDIKSAKEKWVEDLAKVVNFQRKNGVGGVDYSE